MCTSLTANADYLVEYEEDFTLMLNLETAGASLSLGNDVTTITISDGDGMLFHLVSHLLVLLQQSYFFTQLQCLPYPSWLPSLKLKDLLWFV